MWFIKSESEPDERYGKSPEKRNIEELIKTSLVICDKNSGPTSHQITFWVKDIFGVNKAGHLGTLDPAVTGVLPVALENSVKAMPLLTNLEKEYVGVMRLHKTVDEEILKKETLKFVGKITQVPPVKSAVARKPREREIYFFDILEISEKDVLFRVGCEAGTYIRKLVHDLGRNLGGAHMTELRRVRVGNFNEEKSYSLIEIKDSFEIWRETGDERKIKEVLIPIENAIDHVKKIFIKDSAIHSVVNGSPVFVSGITKIQKEIERGELIGIFSLKGELVAIGISKMDSKEMLKRKEGIAVRTDRVFLERGVYPKAE